MKRLDIFPNVISKVSVKSTLIYLALPVDASVFVFFGMNAIDK